MAIRLHRDFHLPHEAHPLEKAVENCQSGPDLEVAGDFGRAAALSFFIALLQSFPFWLRLRWTLTLALLLMGVVRPAVVQAHNPDTSYLRCIVAEDRLEIRLTYDIFTLEKIADLDADRDRRLTRAELRAGAPAIQQFLRQHVLVGIDGQPADLGDALDPVWPAGAGDSLAAPEWHAAASLITFPFRRHVPTPPREIAFNFTFFPQFGALHTVLGVFEHGSSPPQEVAFTEGEPDYLYDASYVATPAQPLHEPVLAAMSRFLRLGVLHIFLGYDHICFLLALIVVGRVGELVKVVTSFTIAHSITLILAALKIATLPGRLIECGVAATIVYVAAENLWRKRITHRWMLTFVFGLIHGFSFANVLAGLGLPREATVRCLLSFNAGVELAQLAIVLAAFPLVMMMNKSAHAFAMKAAVSAAVGLFGLGWFVERAFGFSFMPL